MKCSKCGSEFRITVVKGEFYCFECELDASLEAYGIVTPIKRRRTA